MALVDLAQGFLVAGEQAFDKGSFPVVGWHSMTPSGRGGCGRAESRGAPPSAFRARVPQPSRGKARTKRANPVAHTMSKGDPTRRARADGKRPNPPAGCVPRSDPATASHRR